MKLKVLELFAGIGACSKALKNIGIEYEIVDAVEIDKYAIKSFNAIHGTNFEPQDITKWNKDIEADLITHGSPCQDFSLAGLQAGGDKDSGTRSSLMYETIRIVEKLKPKYVLWENVKNLLSKKHRHNFDAYIEIMNNLGYNSYYQVLNAKDYGIPQNRERVYTISIRKDIAKGFIFPEKEELKLKLKDMLENNVDEKYYLSEKKIYDISHWKGYQKPFEKVQGNNSIVPTLTARGAGEEHNGMITYCDNLENTTNLQEECLNIKNNTKKGYLEAKEGDGVDISSRMQHHRGTVQKGMIQTLDTQGGNNKGVVVLGNYSPSNHEASRIVDTDGIAPTTKENHGTVTGIVEKNLKQQLCDNLIEQGIVKGGEIINHSYTNSKSRDTLDKYVETENGVSPTLTTRPDILGYVESIPNEKQLESQINKIEIPQMVKVRKYAVDTEKLVKTLRNAKIETDITNKEIADKLNIPLTKVEHYFRKDNSFAIPDAQVWLKLKEILNIETNEFDESIMTFEEKEGVYEKANRYYLDNGIAPTLTQQQENIITNLRIRKLTPLECWRLMGFDDEDFYKARSIPTSDAQLYKQAGNSIVVNVLEKIFTNLFKGSESYDDSKG